VYVYVRDWFIPNILANKNYKKVENKVAITAVDNTNTEVTKADTAALVWVNVRVHKSFWMVTTYGVESFIRVMLPPSEDPP